METGVKVGDGVSLWAGVTDETIVTLEVSGRMIGVGLTIPGVREGTGDHTGKGCGWAVNMSHAARFRTINDKTMIFFIGSLYTAGKKPIA